jgi:hypothetical protein
MTANLTATPGIKIHNVTATIRDRSDGLFDGSVNSAKNIFAPRDTLVAADGKKMVEWLTFVTDTARAFNKAHKSDGNGNAVFSEIRVFILHLDAAGNAKNNPYKGNGCDLGGE